MIKDNKTRRIEIEVPDCADCHAQVDKIEEFLKERKSFSIHIQRMAPWEFHIGVTTPDETTPDEHKDSDECDGSFEPFEFVSEWTEWHDYDPDC